MAPRHRQRAYFALPAHFAHRALALLYVILFRRTTASCSGHAVDCLRAADVRSARGRGGRFVTLVGAHRAVKARHDNQHAVSFARARHGRVSAADICLPPRLPYTSACVTRGVPIPRRHHASPPPSSTNSPLRVCATNATRLPRHISDSRTVSDAKHCIARRDVTRLERLDKRAWRRTSLNNARRDATAVARRGKHKRACCRVNIPRNVTVCVPRLPHARATAPALSVVPLRGSLAVTRLFLVRWPCPHAFFHWLHTAITLPALYGSYAVRVSPTARAPLFCG